MPVALVRPYDPNWPKWFEAIRSVLAQIMTGVPCRIEHVGSTAVPGMTAKPIIDLDIIVTKSAFPSAKERLESIGYVHQGDLGIPGREAFDLRDRRLRKTLPPHNPYVCMAGAPALVDHLSFRDFMRKSPDWIRRLSDHKMRLCRKYGDDRASYIAGKSAMVREITDLAKRPGKS